MRRNLGRPRSGNPHVLQTDKHRGPCAGTAACARNGRVRRRIEIGMKGVWIGTSGWSYAGWRGSFYPPDVPQTNWLRYHATVFATTEINTSFYRTPTLEA